DRLRPGKRRITPQPDASRALGKRRCRDASLRVPPRFLRPGKEGLSQRRGERPGRSASFLRTGLVQWFRVRLTGRGALRSDRYCGHGTELPNSAAAGVASAPRLAIRRIPIHYEEL